MTTPPPDDERITQSLEHWFGQHARELPWRSATRDPYQSLVSELMLQQTQVSRVVEKFAPFLDRFPTVSDLAMADEDDVLAAWSGLGYYRRARLLHACAKAIVEHHNAVVPGTVEELLTLPGIGRYTAGAIASIVFGQRAPIVDGNVARVLLRVHNKPVPQTDKDTTCLQCPIQGQCAALHAGTTESIPLPKPKARQKRIYCASVAMHNRDRVVLTQRPGSGMWASMFQMPTLERDDRAHTPDEVAGGLSIADAELIEQFTHITTHRIVEFSIYRAPMPPKTPKNWARHPIQAIDALAISNAQVKAMRIAGILES
jgi:A/G-specific adenine glycosylase